MGITLEELAAEVTDLKIRLNAILPGRAPEAALDDINPELEYLLADYRVGLELAAEVLSTHERSDMEDMLAGAEQAAKIAAANYAGQRARWENRQAEMLSDVARTNKFLSPKAFKIKEERVRNHLHFEPTPTGASSQNAADTRARAADIRERLALDDRIRAANSDALDAGKTARHAIRATAEQRVRNMITSQVSPPRWFEAGLGRINDSPHQQSWLQIAVDVLEFRLCRGVTDELLPLGSAQEAEDGDLTRRSLVEKLESLKNTMYSDEGTNRRRGQSLGMEAEEPFGSNRSSHSREPRRKRLSDKVNLIK